MSVLFKGRVFSYNCTLVFRQCLKISSVLAWSHYNDFAVRNWNGRRNGMVSQCSATADHFPFVTGQKWHTRNCQDNSKKVHNWRLWLQNYTLLKNWFLILFHFLSRNRILNCIEMIYASSGGDLAKEEVPPWLLPSHFFLSVTGSLVL